VDASVVDVDSESLIHEQRVGEIVIVISHMIQPLLPLLSELKQLTAEPPQNTLSTTRRKWGVP
jgi:hypothetical protein